MLPYLVLDWEICKCLSNSRVKERKRRIKAFMFCLDLPIIWAHLGPSAHNTSWAEAIYPDISYCSPLSVWFKGPSCLSRTRCQVEPSSVVRHISMAQVPEVWLPSGQGRGPGYYSPFQEDSRAVFVFGNFKLEGSEKIRNVSLESCSQIFEETRRI